MFADKNMATKKDHVQNVHIPREGLVRGSASFAQLMRLWSELGK